MERNSLRKLNMSPRSGTNIQSKKIKSNNEKITVYCRFRPIAKTEKMCEYFQHTENRKSVLIEAPEDLLQKTNGVKKYIFSRVFDEEVSQKEVFNSTIHPVLLKMLNEGKNALVFTYGVTNAGKTYTIIGDDDNPGILINTISWLVEFKQQVLANKHLIQDNLDSPEKMRMSQKVSDHSQSVKENSNNIFEENPIDLRNLFFTNPIFAFDSVKKSTLVDIDIKIQCFEIYNDELHDLFSKKTMRQKKKKLIIKEVDKRLIIENLKTKDIKSFEEGLKLIKECLKNRSVLQTALNKSSSRSHCIYKINIIFTLESEDEDIKIDKSLTLVDLAGSERAKRTDNTGNKLKEANKINQSLSCLGRCLSALKTKNMPPFRETKLTRYLSEFFVEDNNIIMVANINPKTEDFEESIRALNYTAVAREVEMKSRISNFNFKSSKKIRSKTSIISVIDKKNKYDHFLSSSVGVNLKKDGTSITQDQFCELNNKLDKILQQNKKLYKINKRLFEMTVFETFKSSEKKVDVSSKSKLKKSQMKNSFFLDKENCEDEITRKFQNKMFSPEPKKVVMKNPQGMFSVKQKPLFINHDEYQNFSSQKILEIIDKTIEQEKKCQEFYINNFLKKGD